MQVHGSSGILKWAGFRPDVSLNHVVDSVKQGGNLQVLQDYYYTFNPVPSLYTHFVVSKQLLASAKRYIRSLVVLRSDDTAQTERARSRLSAKLVELKSILFL